MDVSDHILFVLVCAGAKLKKLYEILTGQVKVKLEVLVKCERILIELADMMVKQREERSERTSPQTSASIEQTSGAASSSVAPPPPPPAPPADSARPAPTLEQMTVTLNGVGPAMPPQKSTPPRLSKSVLLGAGGSMTTSVIDCITATLCDVDNEEDVDEVLAKLGQMDVADDDGLIKVPRITIEV